MTPYQILGVHPPISMDELKAAYRKVAASVHPDRGGDHQAMVEVNQAYAQAKLDLEIGMRNHPQPKSKSQPRHQPSPEKILEFWTFYIDGLLDVQSDNDYKTGWIAFHLLDCKLKPPIGAWEYLAQKLGHKKGWAWHKHGEWG